MKKIIASLIGLGVVAYGGTVAYLQKFDHETAIKLPQNSPTRSDPVALSAFNAINEARCDYCHIPGRKLPFYFNLPIANSLMQHDLTEGHKHFILAPVIEDFALGKAPNEEQLSRIEEVVSQDRMPPAKYLLMHWHAHLSQKERQALLDWVANVRKNHYATTGATAALSAEPICPLPEKVDVNAQKVALGKKLFFDKKLSGDGQLNCASCHSLKTGGVDNLVTATGIYQQKGPINVPTVYDAYFKIAQFWDGRAPDLAAQAAGPVMNPKEMGSHDWQSVSQKLLTDPAYPPMFAAAFGGAAKPSEQTITQAIAEYEKTLVTPNSPFDRYLKGDSNALSAQEKHGYQRFKELGCAGCHNSLGVGGQGAEVMGLYGDYFAQRGTPHTPADDGIYAQTKNENDRHRFIIPNLRNVALTYPYFHDGSVKTLEDAVEKMVRYQTPYGKISQQDVSDIVSFLRSLTGTYEGKTLVNTNTK